jgi:hypothetical protein
MVRIARSLVTVMAGGMLVAGAGMAMPPAASASSSSVVELWFSNSGTGLQLCSDPGTFYYDGAAAEVYNPCGGRVWVHYTAGTTVQSYCVNPRGGLAYDLPITWKAGDTTNIQVTTNTTQCDASATGVALPFIVEWVPPDYLLHQEPYDCNPSASDLFLGGNSIGALETFCNFRIWIHVGDDGSGASYCIDPNPSATGDQGYSPPNDREFWQVRTTNIQAPCNAGSPPYTTF